MSRDLRLRAFAAATLVPALALMALTVYVEPVTPSPVLIGLAIVAMLSEILAFEFSSLNFSITFAVCAATIILLGPAAGSLVTALSTIPAAFTVKDKPLLRGVFNLSQLTLASLAAGWLYLLAGGWPIAGHPLGVDQIPRVLVPIALLALATFTVNTTLVSLAVSISSGTPFTAAWKSAFAWTIPSEAALTVLGLALAQVVASEGLVGLALFVVPLMIARQFYERYVILRRAYADTIRSLVAVIEAKDAYTRGHSERVSRYAVEIGRRLGFSDQRIERLELAALLHDLGKVAISKSILLKDAGLDDEEFAAIRAHPEIGAHIIESVPFLADLVPLILSHHERVDGTGYGSQLAGEDIPLEARVLSVADAFDAMTSSRPYRPALTPDETIRELRRHSGRQFDEVIVETFVESLPPSSESVPPGEAADEAV